MMFSRLLEIEGPDCGVGLGVGAGVGFDGGVGDEIGLIVPVAESFTDAVGTAASRGVVTEPMLRLLGFDEDVEGSEAGTTPLVPVDRRTGRGMRTWSIRRPRVAAAGRARRHCPN